MSRRPQCRICGSDATRRWHAYADVAVWICRSCGARFVFPIPDSELLRRRYRAEHERGKWKELLAHTLEEELRRRVVLLTRLKGADVGRLLDVGCGDGRFLDVAREAGWRTLGMEIAHVAAALASSLHGRLVGELDAVKEEPMFDAVTFWDVLEHMPDPGQTLRQVHTRLRRGGLVVITMPNLSGTTSWFMGTRWPYYDFSTYGHIHHLALKHVCSLLRSAGLEPVYRETHGSVNLRDVAARYGLGSLPGPIRWLLDKGSGMLARVAERLGWGNTMLVVGRKVS